MNYRSASLALLCACVSYSGATSVFAREFAVRAPNSIELRDQYDEPQKLSFPSELITVLAIADRKGSDQIGGWIAGITEKYDGRLSLLGIADIGGAPRFLHGRIRKGFKKSRSYPVMMDWSGKICEQLGYEKDRANILIIDRDGAILARFVGEADKEKLAATLAVLAESVSDTPGSK